MSDKPIQAQPHVAPGEGPTRQDEAMHAEEAHEGPIRTPKQLIVTIVASFLIPIVIIVLLVSFVDFGSRTSPGSDLLAAQSVAERLQPVGHVEVRDASAPQVLHTGEEVFKGQCSACHANGVAGAPKFGDAAAWGPRITQGYDTLWHTALKGKGAMGPQGGGDYSDLEVGRAVVYMANHGGANFPVPQPAAEAASGADPGASAATASAAASTPN
ncbi:MAG: c-type cytochrome [Pseudomonadota bacterium]|nr:c-type cytochrome [Pseudomonadota bacterium]